MPHFFQNEAMATDIFAATAGNHWPFCGMTTYQPVFAVGQAIFGRLRAVLNRGDFSALPGIRTSVTQGLTNILVLTNPDSSLCSTGKHEKGLKRYIMRTILAVDDEQNIRLVGEHELIGLHHVPWSLCWDMGPLELAETDPRLDLIVLGIKVAPIKDIQVLRQLWTENSDIPEILVMAYSP
jgi:hypothetical protein